MTIVIVAVEVAVVLNRCPPATSPRRDPCYAPRTTATSRFGVP
ncbi:hypothetical protein [Amycolatopsis sp. lyj-112]